MNCETCQVRDFVHSDLYCSTCPDKPKPKIKNGEAYLYLKNKFTPVCSVVVEVPEGMEKEYSAVALLEMCRVDFIESDSNELSGANS